MNTPQQQAADRLQWQMEAWKSIELRVHEERDLLGSQFAGAQGIYKNCEYHYIETATGNRFYEFIGKIDGKVAERSCSYREGQRFASVTYDVTEPDHQAQVYISDSFGHESELPTTDRPRPLLNYFVGKQPLSEAILKARVDGTERVADRDCGIFLMPKVRMSGAPQDLRVSLDNQTGVPLKVSLLADDGRPRWEWEAKDLTAFGSYHMPVNSTYKRFEPDGSIAMLCRFKVVELRYDKNFDKSTFWPIAEPGVPVVDNVQRKVFAAPGKKVSEKVGLSGQSAVPVRATPPFDWSGTAAFASLGVGSTLALLALIVWWRRR